MRMEAIGRAGEITLKTRKTRPKTRPWIILTILMLLVLVAPTYGEVYVSDHFDASGWNSWEGDTTEPPSPWITYYSDNLCYTVSPGHGGSGNAFRIGWGTGQTETALQAPYSLNGHSEYWIGFRYRHKAPFDWGSCDGKHKWIHWGTGDGESFMVNYNKASSGIRWFWGGATHLHGDLAFDNADGAWHYFIMHLKHNTQGPDQAGYRDGQIEMWRDGTEITLSIQGASPYADSDSLWFGNSSGFGGGGGYILKFGFQFHSGLASGQWEDWDDIIVASTKEEVENFLGEVGQEPDTEAPTSPSGLRILTK